MTNSAATEPERRMKMQITFKSGAQVVVDVERFETQKGPISAELVSLKWTTPAGWTSKLHYLGGDLSDIQAIVAIDEPLPAREGTIDE